MRILHPLTGRWRATLSPIQSVEQRVADRLDRFARLYAPQYDGPRDTIEQSLDLHAEHVADLRQLIALRRDGPCRVTACRGEQREC